MKRLMIEDSALHQGMRRKLIDQLRDKGIQDEAVLDSMSKIPRHLFMDSTFIKFAYADQAFPIAAGQTISQPYTVAYQTQLLEVKPHFKVLEIGSGSGYQAAVLSLLGARVFSIERIRSLYQSAQSLLHRLGYPARLFYGDGYLGLPAFAPFDRILITAAIPGMPEKLIDQLALGGIMVMPHGKQGHQTMKRIIRMTQTETRTTEHGSFVFVPMIAGTE